jgi:hypothetical protein
MSHIWFIRIVYDNYARWQQFLNSYSRFEAVKEDPMLWSAVQRYCFWVIFINLSEEVFQFMVRIFSEIAISYYPYPRAAVYTTG